MRARSHLPRAALPVEDRCCWPAHSLAQASCGRSLAGGSRLHGGWLNYHVLLSSSCRLADAARRLHDESLKFDVTPPHRPLKQLYSSNKTRCDELHHCTCTGTRSLFDLLSENAAQSQAKKNPDSQKTCSEPLTPSSPKGGLSPCACSGVNLVDAGTPRQCRLCCSLGCQGWTKHLPTPSAGCRCAD